MKTSDLIASRIKEEVDTVFGVTGGNIINVVDSFHKAGLRIVSMHHEQSAAIAADAYARFKGFGVCYATSGPGVTNLVTGVACSYFDSIPVLAIGGQVPSKFLDGPDRQMGFQEVDGCKIFNAITKKSRRFNSIHDLDSCILNAREGRPGPSFIEIPDDIQRVDVEEESNLSIPRLSPIGEWRICFERFSKAILIVGSGANLGMMDIKMPFLCTWGTKDTLWNHPYCKGDFGITGSPHGNQLLKEADCIIMIGTRMDSHQVPNWDTFAPQAYKVAIGLEFPHKVDEKISMEGGIRLPLEFPDWCKRAPENTTDTPIYRWVDELSYRAGCNHIIIPDMGQTGCIVFQRWKVKEGQRLFNGINHSPMGYSLPGAIGASIATGRETIVIVGEGSLMMNLQDLQTISDLNLPIHIFVVKNGGYGMIRQTQRDWEKYLDQGIGCNFKTPDVVDLAQAFRIRYANTMTGGPSICSVEFEDTRILPKWKFGDPI